jgi:hypothetical protein
VTDPKSGYLNGLIDLFSANVKATAATRDFEAVAVKFREFGEFLERHPDLS